MGAASAGVRLWSGRPRCWRRLLLAGRWCVGCPAPAAAGQAQRGRRDRLVQGSCLWSTPAVPFWGAPDGAIPGLPSTGSRSSARRRSPCIPLAVALDRRQRNSTSRQLLLLLDDLHARAVASPVDRASTARPAPRRSRSTTTTSTVGCCGRAASSQRSPVAAARPVGTRPTTLGRRARLRAPAQLPPPTNPLRTLPRAPHRPARPRLLNPLLETTQPIVKEVLSQATADRATSRKNPRSRSRSPSRTRACYRAPSPVGIRHPAPGMDARRWLKPRRDVRYPLGAHDLGCGSAIDQARQVSKAFCDLLRPEEGLRTQDGRTTHWSPRRVAVWGQLAGLGPCPRRVSMPRCENRDRGRAGPTAGRANRGNVPDRNRRQAAALQAGRYVHGKIVITLYRLSRHFWYRERPLDLLILPERVTGSCRVRQPAARLRGVVGAVARSDLEGRAQAMRPASEARKTTTGATSSGRSRNRRAVSWQRESRAPPARPWLFRSAAYRRLRAPARSALRGGSGRCR